jgi:hypothetical protein
LPASAALSALLAAGWPMSLKSCGASLRPRFGASTNRLPLPRSGSAGRSSTTSAVASTLPCASRGALSMSAITALRGSAGSTAIVARPVIRT